MVSFKLFYFIIWIVATALNISVKKHLMHKLGCTNDVSRIGTRWICNMSVIHHTNLIYSAHIVSKLDCLGTCQKLVRSEERRVGKESRTKSSQGQKNERDKQNDGGNRDKQQAMDTSCIRVEW